MSANLSKNFKKVIKSLSSNKTEATISGKFSEEELKTITENLKKNTSLKSLEIHGTNKKKLDVADQQIPLFLQALSDNTSLHSLIISDAQLFHLDLNGLNKLLHKSPTLTSVLLGNVAMDADTTNDLAEGLKANVLYMLQLIAVTMRNASATAFIAALGINSSLRVLEVDIEMYAQDQLAFYRALPSCRSLEDLNISLPLESELRDNFTAFSLSLNTDSNLKRLKVNYLNKACLVSLAKALRNSNIESLDIHKGERAAWDEYVDENNVVDYSGLEVLASELANNQTLTNLSIDWNSIISSEVGLKLAAALKTNTKLKILTLSVVDMNITGIKALLDQIAKNSRIEELFLEGDGFKKIASNLAVELAKLLKSTTSNLRKLTLKKIIMTDDNLKLLTDALISNVTLIALKIEQKSFSSQDIKRLAEVLNGNHSLQDLELGDSFVFGLETNDVKALSDAIAFNPTLISCGAWYDKNSNAFSVLVGEEDLNPDVEQLNERIKRNIRYLRNWTVISFFLAFARANFGHAFQYSGLPLISTILNMALPNKSFLLIDKNVKDDGGVAHSSIENRFNLIRFTDSKYFKAHLNDNLPHRPQTAVVEAASGHDNNTGIHKRKRL